MMLGDLGAEVIRIDRAGASASDAGRDPLLRNRRSCGVLAPLLEACQSGKGQVVDAAMVDAGYTCPR
jgi:crotonobetainyl-CoA:carnitine CoA-transferase CaiB-like acyl-CoA transferase